jgi:hypothetical protein
VAEGVEVLGQLANFLTIPPAYRPALEAALGQRLALLLLPTQADLWPLLADNPQSLLAAVLADVQPIPPQPKLDDTAVIAWANEMVDVSDLSGFQNLTGLNRANLTGLVNYLLSPILLVADRRAAYRLALDLPPGTMAVAPDGFLVYAGGLVQTAAADGQETILAREEAWRQAQQAVAAKRDELVGLETAVSDQRTQIEELQAQADQKQQAESRLGRLLQEANQKLGQAQRRLDQITQQQQFVARQQATRLVEVERLQARIAEVEARRDGLQTELVEVETAVVIAVAHLEKLPIAESQPHDQETRYTQARIHLSQQQTSIEGLQERIKTDLGIVALHYDEDQTGPTPLPIVGVQRCPGHRAARRHRRDDPQLPRADAAHGGHQSRRARRVPGNPGPPRLPHRAAGGSERNRSAAAQSDRRTGRADQPRLCRDGGQGERGLWPDVYPALRRRRGPPGAHRPRRPDDQRRGHHRPAAQPARAGAGLLSGGERSLTAAALIFSLLKVSPTPFCIMDEVDAALDEANINRFRDLLRELALGTQFIVITHNRGTVQAAQTIYGISMGTISRLSFSLNDRVQARGGCGVVPSRADPFVRVDPSLCAAKPRCLQPMLGGMVQITVFLIKNSVFESVSHKPIDGIGAAIFWSFSNLSVLSYSDFRYPFLLLSVLETVIQYLYSDRNMFIWKPGNSHIF